MQPRRIQLKHPHGPICIILEYLPELEQLNMQGVNHDFYEKVIPGILRKFNLPRAFLFPKSKMNDPNDENYGITFRHVTKRGQII